MAAGRDLEPPPKLTIGALLQEKTKLKPSAPAVSFDTGSTLSREELNVLSNEIATGLLIRGCQPGDRVATMMHNRPEQVVLFFAVAKMGGIFTPLNVSLGDHDLHSSLKAADASVLVIERELLTPARDNFLRDMDLRLVVLEPNSRLDKGTLEALTSPAHPSSLPEVVATDPAGILFTGGTTGVPKGVLRSHYSYICSAVRYGEILSPTTLDRHYCISHLFHGAGQETGLIGPLYHDVPTHFSRWFSASEYITRAANFGATLGEMLGAMLIAILRHARTVDQIPTTNIRALLCANSSVDPADIQAFRELLGVDHMLDVYAMTETGMLLFANTVNDKKAGAVGQARGWCEVRIADEHDYPLSTGRVGNILLRPTVPYSMGSGYFREPEATVDHYRNLWLHTGDRGSLDDEGWLYFAGRQSHWLRKRGENVSCIEVEQTLDSHEAVRESVIVGVPSAMSEEDILAIIVLEGSTSAAITKHVAAEEFRRHCEEALASFKAPDYIALSETPLPRTAAKGEIDRKKVAELELDNVWSHRPSKTTLRFRDGKVLADRAD